jgi:tetratricopeptide (TPR) repeat protein
MASMSRATYLISVWATLEIALGWSTLARAQSVLIVDVSLASVDLKVRRQVLEALAQGLRAKPNWRVEVSQVAADGGNIDQEIKNRLAQAKSLSRSFQEKEALNKLEEAERSFRENYGSILDLQLLLAVLSARARLEMDLGTTDAAAETLKRIALLAPGFTLDPGAFVPALVKRFNELQAEVSRQAKGTLRVTSPAKGVMVWLDGKERGPAPQTFEIAAGEHYVAVGSLGQARGKVIEVNAGKTIELALESAAPTPRTDQALRALGQALAVSGVLAVEVLPRGDQYLTSVRAIQVKTVTPPRSLRAEAATLERLAWTISELALKVPSLFEEQQRPVIPTRRRVVEKPSIWRQWWFWAAIGAVVGGGVATTVVLTQRDPGVHLRLER